MGTISSVYLGPAGGNEGHTDSHNDENVSENVSSETNQSEGNVMEVHLSHSSFSNGNAKDEKDEDAGGTIQYLAQENVKLVQMNKQLTCEVERLKKELEESNAGSVNDTDIFGETKDQKITRLENLLATERHEKWEIIEKSEKTRVDLVNSERELSEKTKHIIELQNELENSKRQINELELVPERLKTDTKVEMEDTTEPDEEPSMSSKSKAELDRFRKDLLEKREARRKALSAVSGELNKLREELENEKEVRRKLEREMLLQKKTETIQDDESASDISIVCVKKENETLKMELNILTEDIQKLKELRTENSSLKVEIRQLGQEIRSLNTIILQLKNDYKEEKRKHERTNREKARVEEEKERNVKMRKDLEHEKERMWEEYDKEKEEINKRTAALKEVIEISRQMLTIRESQVQELKTKLKEIEESVSHSKILEEEGLRAEYEKQLENIKTLKELYEERVKLMEMERDKLRETISQHIKTIEDQKGEIDELKEQYGNTTEELEKEKTENQALERNLKMSIARSKDFENELAVINNMFTQMLLGPFNTGNDTDLDKLTEFLQENHELITELTTKEDSSEIASAFPKLLLDLMTRVEENEPDPNLRNSVMMESTDTISEQSESILAEHQEETSKSSEPINPAVQEIASNLPKVWKVLTELLSIHSAPEGPIGDEKQCYKNVETPYGTKSVISVSNTFIRLKDLILEKKSLQKELIRLKQLNSHLEIRLDDQEKRLSQVQCELHKTWGIVGRMRAQHQQLHNHEKILRYELQEKRVMLSELKQELEYCRDKWERARQKNDESETEWKKLRREFAARKIKNNPDTSLNDSAESGYSDEQNESGEEAENFDADRSSTQSPIDKKLATEESEEQPGTSRGAIPRTSQSSREQRAIRLKRLEDQCQLLVRQVDITTHKSNFLSNRLEELHEQCTTSEEIRRPIVLKRDSEGASSSEVVELPIDISRAQMNQTEEAAVCLEQIENSQPLTYASVKNESEKETREERLNRLENEGQALVASVVGTVEKSEDLSSKLDEIHNKYLQYEASKEAQSNARENREEELCRLETETLALVNEVVNSVERSNVNVGEELDCNQEVNEQADKWLEGDTRVSDANTETREERLARLENECQSLVQNATGAIKKSKVISDKLEEVEENYVQYEAGKEAAGCVKEVKETREERLKRLEREGQALLSKSVNTLERSEDITNKLDDIHAKFLEREASKEEDPEPKRETREERLNRLEAECESFAISVSNTVEKSSHLSEKLDEIHEGYLEYEASKCSAETKETKDEQLKRLEEEAYELVKNVEGTVEKITELPNTLVQVHENNVQCENGEEAAVCSNEVKETRDERLKRLENEGQALLSKTISTLEKSEDITNKLDDMHNKFLEHEASKKDSPQKHETREERLNRLEEECKTFVSNVSNTVERSQKISEKLDEIHEGYLAYESSKPVAEVKETREMRLQQLEEEAGALATNVAETVEKSHDLSEKLTNIHAGYVQHEESKELKHKPESREERLNRLELEAQSIIGSVNATVAKSENLSNKLEGIHEGFVQYEAAQEAKSSDDCKINAHELEEACALEISTPETRSERLKRLEEECKSLMKKVKSTVGKSEDLSNKLEDIHDTYVNYEVSKMDFEEPNMASQGEDSFSNVDNEEVSETEKKNQ